MSVTVCNIEKKNKNSKLVALFHSLLGIKVYLSSYNTAGSIRFINSSDEDVRIEVSPYSYPSITITGNFFKEIDRLIFAGTGSTDMFNETNSTAQGYFSLWYSTDSGNHRTVRVQLADASKNQDNSYCDIKFKSSGNPYMELISMVLKDGTEYNVDFQY